MQSTSPGRDLAVGVFVLIGIGAMGVLSLQIGEPSFSGDGGFELIATFDDVGGLSRRAPAMISGVKVGRVTEIELDEMLRARVVLDLALGLELPVDSTASIRTQGLLGDKFVSLELGAEDAMLVSGEEVAFTDSALNIESLISIVANNLGLSGGGE